MKPSLSTYLTISGLLLLLALFTGCSVFHSPVPESKLCGTIGGQKFQINNPKDTTITNLVIEVNTNGQAKLSMGFFSSSNNSNVIASATSGQAETINAMGTALVNAVNAGAQVAGKVGAAAIKP